MTSRKATPKHNAPEADSKVYEVGYKKPPIKNQFKPGKSGNPSGRRKRRPSPEELLYSLMSKQVSVNENGIPKKITRTEALVHKLFSAAMKGEVRAVDSIIKILSKQAAKIAAEQKPLDLRILTDDELKVLLDGHERWAELQMNEEIKEVKRKYGVKDV